MALIDRGVRSLVIPSFASAALWALYAVLQVLNWVWQRSAFSDFPPDSGSYIPPVATPVLRLLWMAGVLAALVVIAVVLYWRAADARRVVAQGASACGGLVVGFVSLWLTPSEFGFGGNYLQEPTTRFTVGVLLGTTAAAAFLALALITWRGRGTSRPSSTVA
jgi:hypothetical protein